MLLEYQDNILSAILPSPVVPVVPAALEPVSLLKRARRVQHACRARHGVDLGHVLLGRPPFVAL